MVIHLPASYTSDDPVCSLENRSLPVFKLTTSNNKKSSQRRRTWICRDSWWASLHLITQSWGVGLKSSLAISERNTFRKELLNTVCGIVWSNRGNTLKDCWTMLDVPNFCPGGTDGNSHTRCPWSLLARSQSHEPGSDRTSLTSFIPFFKVLWSLRPTPPSVQSFLEFSCRNPEFPAGCTRARVNSQIIKLAAKTPRTLFPGFGKALHVLRYSLVGVAIWCTCSWQFDFLPEICLWCKTQCIRMS